MIKNNNGFMQLKWLQDGDIIELGDVIVVKPSVERLKIKHLEVIRVTKKFVHTKYHKFPRIFIENEFRSLPRSKFPDMTKYAIRRSVYL